jgi:hypothetical protein
MYRDVPPTSGASDPVAFAARDCASDGRTAGDVTAALTTTTETRVGGAGRRAQMGRPGWIGAHSRAGGHNPVRPLARRIDRRLSRAGDRVAAAVSSDLGGETGSPPRAHAPYPAPAVVGPRTRVPRSREGFAGRACAENPRRGVGRLALMSAGGEPRAATGQRRRAGRDGASRERRGRPVFTTQAGCAGVRPTRPAGSPPAAGTTRPR